MSEREASIRPLSSEVIAQIKSSISITHLQDVIVELVKNSLDADATKIDVEVDFAKGGCCVEDNGLGIQSRELDVGGNLGQAYCKRLPDMLLMAAPDLSSQAPRKIPLMPELTDIEAAFWRLLHRSRCLPLPRIIGTIDRNVPSKCTTRG